MTCDSIGGVWKWAPYLFIPSILKGWHRIHSFFISSACRTEFGLLLGREVKKEKKKPQHDEKLNPLIVW